MLKHTKNKIKLTNANITSTILGQIRITTENSFLYFFAEERVGKIPIYSKSILDGKENLKSAFNIEMEIKQVLKISRPNTAHNCVNW